MHTATVLVTAGILLLASRCHSKMWFSGTSKHAGRCGPTAPRIDGQIAICNPNDPRHKCCSKWGWCGKVCSSQLNPPAAKGNWFTHPHEYAGRCGPEAPKIDGQVAGCNPNNPKYKCCSKWGWCGTDCDSKPSPPAAKGNWYTYPHEHAGRCGPEAPKIDGQEAGCNPDDPKYKCCGKWGYCGTDCDSKPSPPAAKGNWYTYPHEHAGRCGPEAPKIDGQEAGCNPDDPKYKCCGKWGYCGTDCDSKPSPPAAKGNWYTYPHEHAGRCGPEAPKIDGQEAGCNPDDPKYKCCGKWGYCGTDCDSKPIPPAAKGNWYTYPHKHAGRCGPKAPKIDGQEAGCNPDDPKYKCCGKWGYCGTDCDSKPIPPAAKGNWYTYPHEHAGRCGPEAPKINGQEAGCNPDNPKYKCCSKWGYCNPC